MKFEITTRHGATLSDDQRGYLQEKAEKLRKYFDRLMSIEVEVDERKHDWWVEIFVSAEHKHDFVAKEQGPNPQTAMDLCVHKIEEQLRRYKERVQHHKGDPSIKLATESDGDEATDESEAALAGD